MTKHLVLPVAIGLAGLAMAWAIATWGGPLTIAAQVDVADSLLVRVGGPQLGARPIDDNIVLVLFDFKTAGELGYVHSYPDDAKLMRNLIDAGATVVYDTRMVAAADDKAFADVQPLLDDMLEINREGHVMRDVWLSADLLTKTEGRYDKLLAQNVINSHPHALPIVESRLYPLVYFVSTGPAESAPLAIARIHDGLARAAGSEVSASLRESGIMSQWHKQAPEIVPASDISPAPYRMGKREINWHPFQSTTSLVPPAAFWVSYDPNAAEYKRFSFLDVLRNADPQDFKDKIVIVGFAADIDPTSDTYSVPSLHGKAAAAEVVACATQTLLDNRTLRSMPKPMAFAAMAALILPIALVAGLMKPQYAAIASLGMLLLYYVFAVGSYRAGWYPDCLITPASALMTAVAAGVGNAWLNLRIRKRVLDLFGRYVPRAVVNQLMQRPELESLMLGGVVREVTVLFADIRGFTTFAQDLSPEDVVRELNSLLQVMVTCTFENEGTLDKFIGDAILVLFNAPLDQPDHTERAVRTAVTIQERLAGHSSGLRVGVGVHSGAAVVGNIGTPQRMEYTAIGSTVNIAARLCEFAKPGDVVVSRQVAEHLTDQFKLESLGEIQVKGIAKPLAVSRIAS